MIVTITFTYQKDGWRYGILMISARQGSTERNACFLTHDVVECGTSSPEQDRDSGPLPYNTNYD